MRIEIMNLYETCKRFIDLKAELEKTMSKKSIAVELENFEEAEALYSHERVLSLKVENFAKGLTVVLSNTASFGINDLTAYYFKTSLFAFPKRAVFAETQSEILSRIARAFGARGRSERITRQYDYYIIHNWIEFFTERRDWLQKQMNNSNILDHQRSKIEEELDQIEKDLFDNLTNEENE